MADVTPGIAFVGIQPCRVADTRGNGAPIQGGIFANSALRTWDVTNICGIPAGTEAISVNFSVVAAGGIPPGSFFLAWPTGQPPPPTAIMTYGPGQIISNAAIVPLGPGEQLNVNVSGSTHIVMDVNGYFSDRYNPSVSFHAVSINAAPAILAENTSTASDAVAVRAVITTTSPGPTGVAAVQGFNQGTNNTGVGVWGKHNGGGWGVLGEAASGFGVVATAGGSGSNAAVYARNTSTGVSSAVFGWANSSVARNYGIQGWTDSTQLGAAGVFGQDGSGPTAVVDSVIPAGVRGESNSYNGVLGVIGPDGAEAVRGSIVGGPSGYLGYQGSYHGLLADYGVFSQGSAFVAGNLTVSGTISASMNPFIQPHPFDPSKQIRYVSLEGPHSEVYFRGTAQVLQGVTRIPIPEDFRLVADVGTYSTLVTPMGAMATVAVMSQGEDGIVIQASRNVKVAYVVYAEREAMKNPDPIIENVDFRPNPDQDPSGFPDSYRRLMIQNGTLNADGTVNMETARRLGWDKEWEKRSRPAPQPATE